MGGGLSASAVGRTIAFPNAMALTPVAPDTAR
jgi:hypothetical protein